MERKDQLDILKIIRAGNIEAIKSESLQELAVDLIAEAELMERASGGVEKLEHDEIMGYSTYKKGFNSAIDLCNAHWVEKMKGIPLFLAKGEGVKEPSDEYIKGWNDYRQAIIHHLTEVK